METSKNTENSKNAEIFKIVGFTFIGVIMLFVLFIAGKILSK
tara:strand:- start:770 stop:895 length:126 start_codon:yes stop_codon:yes gene_type:complete